VIIPAIAVFAHLGPLIYLDSLTDLDSWPSVMWIAAIGAVFIAQGGLHLYETRWGYTLILASLAASMLW
jgi:hypothetical protein